MSLVAGVLHSETKASWLDILIGDDLVTRNVDIPLDLGLLRPHVSIWWK